MILLFGAARPPLVLPTLPAAVAESTPGPTQPIFVQETAMPPTPLATLIASPIASPAISFLPFDSPSPPLFTFGPTIAPTAPPTREPTAPPTPPPTPPPPRANFSWNQRGNSLQVHFVGSSNQNIANWEWTIEGGGTRSGREVDHTFPDYGSYKVTLTVTNENGTRRRSKTVNLPRPDCDENGQPPGCNPTPPPTEPPPPPTDSPPPPTANQTPPTS